MALDKENALGAYLKDRRTKLDAAALGYSTARRRTPGLRREEVAQRANVSATWYTWLEQGRGGAPSSDVLDRIARALLLTEVEREHLFFLALGRPPEPRYQSIDSITPRLQHVLDILEFSPAFIKTATWDIVAWNRAAAAVFTDYESLPPNQRNILRIFFGDPSVRAKQTDWKTVARFIIAAFRVDIARAGATESIKALVDELCETNPDFAALWSDNDVRSHGEGAKQIHHPKAGKLAFEYSAFAVDGRPDLALVVYNPATPEDVKRVRSLVKRSSKTVK
jgi:transcriptional regulator with XRE-family HTH domain